MSWSYPFGWLPKTNNVHEQQLAAVKAARDVPSYLARGPGAIRLAVLLAIPSTM